MTEIRDTRPAEAVDSKANNLPKNNPSMSVTVLFVASLMLSFVNGLGLIYAVSIVNRLSDISSKVATIDDFEDRVSRQLAGLNHGIHTQFDRLGSRLVTSGLLADRMGSGAMTDQARPSPSTSAESDRSLARAAAYLMGDWQTNGVADAPGPVPGRFMHVSKQTGTVSASGFTRVVMPDGKIIYRKIQPANPTAATDNEGGRNLFRRGSSTQAILSRRPLLATGG